MRFAICLSGQARLSELTRQSLFNNIVGNHDVDFFVHTWSDSIDQLVCIQTKRNLLLIISKQIQKLVYFIHEKMLSNPLYRKIIIKLLNYEKRISKLYQPKAIKTQSWNEIKSRFNVDESKIITGPGTIKLNRIYSFFYSLKEADLLRQKYEQENDFKYDLVMRTRFDLLFQEKLNITSLVSRYKNGFLYVPVNNNVYSVVTDQVAFGDSYSMEIYSKIYDSIDELYNNGTIFHPETLLKSHIEHNKLPLIREPLKYKIFRQMINLK